MQPTPRSESAKLSPCKFQSPLLLALSERGVRMSVIMGGLFPALYLGAFGRTRCSDSSSVNPTDPGYCSPIARATVQRQPRPYFIKVQEQEWTRAPGTPHGSVAYCAVPTNFGAPSQVYMWTYQESRPDSPQEPAIPRHEADSVNSKSYARMCRLAVVALALAKVGVPVAAVARSVSRNVKNDTATVKAGNVMFKGASAIGLQSNVRPHTTSSPTSTTSAAAAIGPRGNSTVTAPREAGHYKRCGGTGQGWKANLSSSSSSSSSSSLSSSSQSSSSLSSWLATTGTTWPTSESTGCEVPCEPLLHNVGGLTTQRQRTVATTPARARITEGAAASVDSSTSQAPDAMVAATSSAIASSAGKTECEDTGSNRRKGAPNHSW
ncbi:uncharacterized protein [Dermacentor andersoni]|uniref:uncharacterized protein n=1 Tax=Dermacentor andersoni TaxID=34620 RepID=UPI002416443D|nr:uncharacterized protein LOC126528107 [Dermacentor andersoni]